MFWKIQNPHVRISILLCLALSVAALVQGIYLMIAALREPDITMPSPTATVTAAVVSTSEPYATFTAVPTAAVAFAATPIPSIWATATPSPTPLPEYSYLYAVEVTVVASTVGEGSYKVDVQMVESGVGEDYDIAREEVSTIIRNVGDVCSWSYAGGKHFSAYIGGRYMSTNGPCLGYLERIGNIEIPRGGYLTEEVYRALLPHALMNTNTLSEDGHYAVFDRVDGRFLGQIQWSGGVPDIGRQCFKDTLTYAAGEWSGPTLILDTWDDETRDIMLDYHIPTSSSAIPNFCGDNGMVQIDQPDWVNVSTGNDQHEFRWSDDYGSQAAFQVHWDSTICQVWPNGWPSDKLLIVTVGVTNSVRSEIGAVIGFGDLISLFQGYSWDEEAQESDPGDFVYITVSETGELTWYRPLGEHTYGGPAVVTVSPNCDGYENAIYWVIDSAGEPYQTEDGVVHRQGQIEEISLGR